LFADRLGAQAVVEQNPRMDGKQMFMLLAPGKKK
jgi:translation initiation factor IF-3